MRGLRSIILADWIGTMARKTRTLNFQEILDALRAHSFDVAPFNGVADGRMVSKGGVGAVLVPGTTDPKRESGGAASTASRRPAARPLPIIAARGASS